MGDWRQTVDLLLQLRHVHCAALLALAVEQSTPHDAAAGDDENGS